MIRIESLYNNYEFKVIQKRLRNKFPWIKEFLINEDDLNDYPVVSFFGFSFDPEELIKQYGDDILIKKITNYSFTNSRPIMFSVFLSDKKPEDNVENYIKTIIRHLSIPEELKLKHIIGSKSFLVGNCIPTKNI